MTVAEPRTSSGATLRPYRKADRAAVRAIACRTAHRGLGQESVFGDEELFADYWTRYYTDFEPECALVAEHAGEVVGYLLGCLDTRRQVRVMATRVVPPLLARLGLRGLRGRYANDRDRRFLRWLASKSWREAPPVPLKRFPAHYHCNIARGAHREGLYSQMACTFLGSLEARGVVGVHGSVIEGRRGIWSRLIAEYERERHSAPIAYERETDFGRDVLQSNRPLVNRAFGSPPLPFLRFIRWLGEARGL